MLAKKLTRRLFMLLLLSSFQCLAPNRLGAQVGANERGVAASILEQTRETIKKNYFDPKFKGIDLDQVFAQAREKMKTAQTRDELMMIIAQTAAALDDSHTVFLPPSRSAIVEYGWEATMIGDRCFIVAIKPGSDAETKGLKVGDRMISIDGFQPTRETLHHIYYRYFALMPAARVRLVVLSPEEKEPRVIDIQTKITKTPNTIDYEAMFVAYLRRGQDLDAKMRYYEYGKDLMVWRLPSFAIHEDTIDAMMGRAKQFKNLILDLRDNGGGYVDIEKRMIGYFFEKEVKLGDERTRKELKPRTAKSRGGDIFTGNLIVLVNHNSASASEVFAKIIQLEKRGKIIGDKTAGAVMTSEFFLMNAGLGNTLYFANTVTVSDLIMPDGKSLEKVGVTPDEIVLPTGKDLSQVRDPVMTYAAKLFRVDITPEKAGTFFPFDWPK